MRGWDEWTTASGVQVTRILYPADPAKDPDTPQGLKWLRLEAEGWPGGIAGEKWQQEMEANPTTGAGQRVWPSWSQKILPAIQFEIEDLHAQEHWPVYCGFDWGIANLTIMTVHAIESLDKMYQIDEVAMRDDPAADPKDRFSVKKFAKECKGRPWWGQIQSIVGDPSIWRRLPRPGEASAMSIGEMFADEGIFIQKGRNEEGVDFAYISLLNGYLWSDLSNPRFMIASHCKETLRCYGRIKKKVNKTLGSNEKAPPEKIVDKNTDPFDANKYIHLTMGFEEPADIQEMPGTFDYYVRQIEQRAEMELNILR